MGKQINSVKKTNTGVNCFKKKISQQSPVRKYATGAKIVLKKIKTNCFFKLIRLNRWLVIIVKSWVRNSELIILVLI